MAGTWDFDAPEFLDFGANEHEVVVGRDSYFDYDHERHHSASFSEEENRKMDPIKEVDQPTSSRLTFDTPVRAKSTAKPSLSDLAEMENTLSTTTNTTPDAYTTAVEDCEDTSQGKVTTDSVSSTSQYVTAVIDTKLDDGDNEPEDDVAKKSEVKFSEDNRVQNHEEKSKEISYPFIAGKSNGAASRTPQMKVRRRSERLLKAKETEKLKDSDQPMKKKKKTFHLTQASTPTMLRRKPVPSMPGTKMKSTAEREIEEIQRLKQQHRRRLEENNKTLRKALAGPARPPSPAKFEKKSKEPHGRHERSLSRDSTRLSSEIVFQNELRQYQPSKGPPKPTVVKPFHFASRKRKFPVKPGSEPYPFNPKSPVNTAFKPSQKREAAKKKGPVKAFAITAAKTPKLTTRTRSRPVHVISNEERERLELEEIKKHQFKAQPLDRHILEAPTALPEVEKRSNTQPEEFHLHLDKRVKERPAPVSEDSPAREFKANPIPPSFYRGPTNLVKHHLEATVPQSPHFVLKKRMEIAHARKEVKESQDKENAKPKPVREAPINAEPKIIHPAPEKKATQPKPFSFDRSDKERYAKKEAKIEEVHQMNKQRANSFRAQPIAYCPNPQDALPLKAARPATRANPFQLESDLRGHARVEKWKAMLQEEEKELRAKTEFRASKDYQKVLSNPGFKPVLGERQNIEPEEFKLRTRTRAAERHRFDELQKDREAAILERERQIELHNQRAEEEEARRQRKEAEHKAAPIRKYSQFSIKESEKAPTVPQSPKFSDRFYKNDAGAK